MNLTIAVSGKGGTGKTTISGLLVSLLVKSGKKPVLAIDADPNSTLSDTLGADVESSIGSLREDVRENIDAIPAGMAKETYLEYQIQDVLIEGEGFDLLVMGRPEGPGCYCYLNSVLRKYIDILSKNYPYVVMDNEAGMEHLARHTTKDADVLLIVSDPSMRGIETAARIRDLAEEERLSLKRIHLVVNRLDDKKRDKLNDVLLKRIKDLKLDLIGTIPQDELIDKLDLEQKAFWVLPEDSLALVAAKEILVKVLEEQ